MKRARPRNHKTKIAGVMGAAIAVLGFLSSTASAEESAYCRKVRARAAADAALLIAPKALAEGVKVPAALQPGGRLDPTTPGAGYQLRGGLSFSVINAWKGIGTMDVAAADCAQHEHVRAGTELLLQAADLGRLNALRKQAHFIDSRKVFIDELLAKMADRLSANSVTALELEDLRGRAALVARERSQIAGEIARLEENGLEPYRGSISDLARKIEESSMRFEREVSHVRSLDAWEIALTGGYIPHVLSQGSDDFFGVLQVSYSLGAPWHNANESRYLGARQEELRSARAELRQQLATLRKQLKASIARAKSELAVIDKRIEEMRSMRGTLETAEASSAAHIDARLAIELVAIEADRVFLVELVEGLSRLEDQ